MLSIHLKWDFLCRRPIDKSDRDDGTFLRSDFLWDKARGHYICPNG
jgi:hypothetical protein